MMTNSEKIAELRGIINQRLMPLITADYMLLDCPYHSNIGDSLIWEGELEFLRSSVHRCLGYSSFHTFLFPAIPPEAIILFHGGGSFGDMWRELQEFRLSVVARYPANRIVILPQTIFYDDKAAMVADAEIMAGHPDLTICARDDRSYKLLHENFRNSILLIPDMAFCIDLPSLDKYRNVQQHKALILRRIDKEIGAMPIEIVGADQRDWPTIERCGLSMFALYKLSGAVRLLSRVPIVGRAMAWITDRFAYNVVRMGNIRTGVRFISQYEIIYTTRLHGAILAVLLDKSRICFIDNSYGKNSGFYQTWLEDLQSIEMLEGSKK